MTKSTIQASIGKLKNWFDAEEPVLINDLPFQRHQGVWSAINKSQLIWSILNEGSYIPNIVLLKRPNGTDEKGKQIYQYSILDGLQRLSTVFAYLNNEFKIHASIPEVVVEDVVYDLAGLTYEELSEECQLNIRNYKFNIVCLEDCDSDTAENLFFSLNSGIPLSVVQKSKSVLGSDLISFFNELLTMDFFTQGIMLSEAQCRKEDDLLLLLQSLMLLSAKNTGREYKTISAAACLEYAKELRGSFSDEQREEITELITYLSQTFPNRNRFLRKGNVPIVAVIASIAIFENITPEDYRAFINSFASEEDTDLAIEYAEASGAGNVKAFKVTERLRILHQAFCDYFGLDIDSVDSPFYEDELQDDEENSETDSSAEEFMNPPE